MSLNAIAYTSEAVPELSPEMLERVVARAAEFNVTAGVTGVLLFDGARFVQYIEGPEDGIAAVYGRICNATEHVVLMELGRGRSSRRLFPFWSMHMVRTEARDLTTVVAKDWDSFVLRAPAARGQRIYGTEELANVVQLHAPEVSVTL